MPEMEGMYATEGHLFFWFVSEMVPFMELLHLVFTRMLGKSYSE